MFWILKNSNIAFGQNAKNRESEIFSIILLDLYKPDLSDIETTLVDQLSFSIFSFGLFLHVYVLVQNSTVQPTGSKRNLTLNYF